MPTPIIVKIALWMSYLLSLFFAIFWFLVVMDKESKTKTGKLKMYPSVSILVPAYNEEKNIIPALASLINIDYPKNKLEIIVVNDGSTDNTKGIVQQFISQNKNS